jgi:hypothetical protein
MREGHSRSLTRDILPEKDNGSQAGTIVKAISGAGEGVDLLCKTTVPTAIRYCEGARRESRHMSVTLKYLDE